MKLVVFSFVLAAASASGLLGVAPLTPYAYSAALLNNYRGPLSLAPGQPANVLGWDGRPLDTLDVNLDRSAHLIAKAYNGGVHLLKKRSVAPLITPITGHLALGPAPLISPAVSLGYGAAHISPYSISPYVSIGAISPYARIASPLISHW